MVEYLKQNWLPSGIKTAILIQVVGKRALQCIVENKIFEPFTVFLHKKKHEIFHLHFRKRCCCCQSSPLAQAKTSMSRGQWQQLFQKIHGRCNFQGLCSCKYESVQNVNVASLDIQTLFILLLNICDLKEKERRNLSELQKYFLTLPTLFEDDECEEDMDDEDYEDSFFASVEHILLDIPTGTGYGEVRENIELLKQRPSEYFHKYLPVVKLFSDRERRTADRIDNLINRTQEKLQSWETECVEYLEANKEENLRNEVTLKSSFSDVDADGLHHRYYVTESFPHFHYVYNLVKDCECHLRRVSVEFDEVMTPTNELIIKISFVGNVSKEDLSMVSKKRGSKKQQDKLWAAVPLICYENSELEKSTGVWETDAMQLLNMNEACHKILIKTQQGDDYTGAVHSSIAVVDRNREELQEAITLCLEEPLICILEKWMKAVGNVSSKAASELYFEMKSVMKHIFKRSPPKALSRVHFSTSKSVVPIRIKQYLYSHAGVNSFGFWRDGVFKVFVACSTNKSKLIDELKTMDPDFFEKHKLEIEAKKFVQKKSLKQGDAIMQNLPKEGDVVCSATLGSLVKQKDNDDSIYGLTCNHIFPLKNQPSYANLHGENTEIGKCVYTTRDKSCDFAVIKVDEKSKDGCDLSFRREDGKRTKANVYTDNDLENIGIVYKRGAETNLTKGDIVSWDYYAVVDEENKDHIFLIKGIDSVFSQQGDSGSVVFSRSQSVHQNSVDVLGMVYASNLELVEDEGEETKQKDENAECSVDTVEKSLESTEPDVKPQNPSTDDHCDEKNCANNDYETSQTSNNSEYLSCCFRMDTAFELLEEEEKIFVKFEDVTSSESSSQSLDSDDSNGNK